MRRGRRGELPAETSGWQAWTSLRINQPEIILQIFELARTTVFTLDTKLPSRRIRNSIETEQTNQSSGLGISSFG